MKDFSANNLLKCSILMEFDRRPIKVKVDIRFNRHSIYFIVSDLYHDISKSLLMKDKEEVKDVMYLFDDIALGSWPRYLGQYLNLLDASSFKIKLTNRDHEKHETSLGYEVDFTKKEAKDEFDISSLEDFVLDLYENLIAF